MSKKTLEKIKKLIIGAYFEKAFKVYRDSFPELDDKLDLIQTRYNDAKRENINGKLSYEDFGIEKTKIAESFLTFINEKINAYEEKPSLYAFTDTRVHEYVEGISIPYLQKLEHYIMNNEKQFSSFHNKKETRIKIMSFYFLEEKIMFIREAKGQLANWDVRAAQPQAQLGRILKPLNARLKALLTVLKDSGNRETDFYYLVAETSRQVYQISEKSLNSKINASGFLLSLIHI